MGMPFSEYEALLFSFFFFPPVWTRWLKLGANPRQIKGAGAYGCLTPELLWTETQKRDKTTSMGGSIPLPQPFSGSCARGSPLTTGDEDLVIKSFPLLQFVGAVELTAPDLLRFTFPCALLQNGARCLVIFVLVMLLCWAIGINQ